MKKCELKNIFYIYLRYACGMCTDRKYVLCMHNSCRDCILCFGWVKELLQKWYLKEYTKKRLCDSILVLETLNTFHAWSHLFCKRIFYFIVLFMFYNSMLYDLFLSFLLHISLLISANFKHFAAIVSLKTFGQKKKKFLYEKHKNK